MARSPAQITLPLVALLLLLPAAWSATFTMTNYCAYTVWPGLLSGAGTAPLSTTGFALARGASAAVDAPAGWSGRMWARTLCAEDAGTGRFACATGDCGSGALQCNGGGAAPPASLAEFTLDGSGGMDFFDVSLVDGYNLPMLVAPQAAAATANSTTGGGPKCVATGCLVDLNDACPADLKVTSTSTTTMACRSACEAFGSPQYCCSGAYGSPSTCAPSAYSQFFKSACPRAYSYAYDDSTSTFTCAAGTNYAITFCPSTTSGKYIDPQAAGVPLTNGTMVLPRRRRAILHRRRRLHCRPCVAAPPPRGGRRHRADVSRMGVNHQRTALTRCVLIRRASSGVTEAKIRVEAKAKKRVGEGRHEQMQADSACSTNR